MDVFVKSVGFDPETDSRYFAHWDNVPKKAWSWPHFTPREMRCRYSNGVMIAPDFMDRLERVRQRFEKPMRVTSAYRTPLYNAQISGTGVRGPHTTGQAVDVAVYGADALRLVRLAIAEGFTGIGLKQHANPAYRFVHLDDLPTALGQPRPWIWTYD